MEKIFSQSYFISANEGNPEGELALTALTANIIEVATLYANSLGIGNPTMAHLHAGWVLSRITIEMERYPQVNTDYTVSTWVESWNRFFSLRAFEITDNDGKVCGYARTVWMVLNTDTHENFGTGHLHLPEEVIAPRECPIPMQMRHKTILPPDSPARASALVATAPTATYTFKYNDIDFYRHVNTVKYVAILLNQYSLQQFDEFLPNRMELSFMHEGKFGETIDINRYDDSDELSSFSFSPAGKPESPIMFGRISLKPRTAPVA